MFIKTYKELKFWQSAHEVSLGIVELCRSLPREKIAWIIADQILRSSFSVGANIAEGFGKFKGKEYRRFLSVALGSANETQYWLELLIDVYPRFRTKISQILSKNNESIKMLSSAIKSLGKRDL